MAHRPVHDDEHLSICDTCGLIYPTPSDSSFVHSRCDHCHGDLLDWADRAQIEPLVGRLALLAERIAQLEDERAIRTADDNTSQNIPLAQ